MPFENLNHRPFRWRLLGFLAVALLLLPLTACGPANSHGLSFFRENGDDVQRALDDSAGTLTERSTPGGSSTGGEYAVSKATGGIIARARKAEKRNDPSAVDWYAAATLELYSELMNAGVGVDSEVFSAYQKSLRGLLANAMEHGRWDGSDGIRIESGQRTYRIRVESTGPHWKLDDYDEIKLASQYSDAKLNNYWAEDGLGLPLVAIREREPGESLVGLRVPFSCTAILTTPRSTDTPPTNSYASLAPAAVTEPSKERVIGVLELHDPLVASDVALGERRIKMTRDLSAPLAWASTEVQRDKLKNFLKVDNDGQRSGLRLIEPYRPGRLPIVFVHGLASDKFTWLDLVNDLRSTPGFSEHFQIWAFQYSTGQSFLRSGYELRDSLQKAREQLDPEGIDPALSDFMLIGHSMGGLVSKLQITSSENTIWDCYFKRPFDEIRIPEDHKEILRDAMFFEPLPFVKRVVFIGSPHRGSSWAHNMAGTLGSMLIRTPSERTQLLEEIKKMNPASSFDSSLATGLPTSIDLLRQDSPLLMAMYELPVSPSVELHNIVGVAKTRFDGRPSDGVVVIDSARHPGTASELKVDATHTELTRHPHTVAELRRILKVHLDAHHPALVVEEKQTDVRRY